MSFVGGLFGSESRMPAENSARQHRRRARCRGPILVSRRGRGRPARTRRRHTRDTDRRALRRPAPTRRHWCPVRRRTGRTRRTGAAGWPARRRCHRPSFPETYVGNSQPLSLTAGIISQKGRVGYTSQSATPIHLTEAALLHVLARRSVGLSLPHVFSRCVV
jgi:hypothetical protein